MSKPIQTCFWCDVALIQRDMPKRDGWYVEHTCPDCGNRYIFAETGQVYIMPPGMPAEGQIWAMEQSYKQSMIAKRGGSNDSTGEAKKDIKKSQKWLYQT